MFKHRVEELNKLTGVQWRISSWWKYGTRLEWNEMFYTTTTVYLITSNLHMDEMKVVGSFSVTRLQNK